MPRTGWVYSDTGKRSEYINNHYDTVERDLGLEQGLGVIAGTTLAAVIVIFLKMPDLATKVADAVIAGLAAAGGVYVAATALFSVEEVYKHDYIPFDRMTDFTYYYDRQHKDEVPNSAKTLYSFWA